MRFVFHLIVMVSVALGVGFGLSWYALTDGRFFGTLQSGPWVAWPDAGAPAPNPYTRAHLVRARTLQLGQAEGLQFTATTDSAREPLTRACTYRVAGHTPIAAFWTLAAVEEDGALIAAPGAEPVIRSGATIRGSDGGIDIVIGKRLSPGNWFELTGEGPYALQLTLYDTVASSGFGASVEVLPEITRESCP